MRVGEESGHKNAPVAGVRSFLRDALIWCVPSLAAGLLVRALLLAYRPYAYWSDDSISYGAFARSVLEEGEWSMDPKRRWLYPVWVLATRLLPGPDLVWLGWLQQALGLAALIGLACAIRASLAHWRPILPVLTLWLALHPAPLHYGSTVLAESLLLPCILLALGAWALWVSGDRWAGPAGWAFVATFAAFLLLKPSSRFALPGAAVALWMVSRRARLRPLQWAALVPCLLLLGPMGSREMGKWLMLTSSFPLVRIDTGRLAPLKQEIADLVTRARQSIDSYYIMDRELGVKEFLGDPSKQETRPEWRELGEKANREKRLGAYGALAIEGILARPDLMAFIALQRAVVAFSQNEPLAQLRADFMPTKIRGEDFARNLEPKWLRQTRGLFGLPASGPPPTQDSLCARVSRAGRGWAADAVCAVVTPVLDWSRLFGPPDGMDRRLSVWDFRPTPTGWLVLMGGVLSLALPRYRAVAGAWALIAASYIAGVYAVGSGHPRFYLPALPMVVLAAGVTVDAAITAMALAWRGRRRGTRPDASGANGGFGP